jgi:hypothetical protein
VREHLACTSLPVGDGIVQHSTVALTCMAAAIRKHQPQVASVSRIDRRPFGAIALGQA